MKKSDYHIHLEKGPLTISYLNKFIKHGSFNDVDEFGFTEHTFRFKEFKKIYEENIITDHTEIGQSQKKFLNKEFKDSIYEYMELLKKARKSNLPVRAGLEVDYFPGIEHFLEEVASFFSWDYITGAVHFISGWGFDFPDQKTINKWKDVNVDRIYKQFFSLLRKAAGSGIFDVIAHPDNIKVYGYKPHINLEEEYKKTAKLFQQNDVSAEINTGLMYRYPAEEICPSRQFLKICNLKGVSVVMGSDAHLPEDCGRYQESAVKLAQRCGYQKYYTYYRREKYENKISFV